MPSKWTFQVKPIKEMLEKYKVGCGWIDPFCGFLSPAEYRNDLNPDNTHAKYHYDALDFLLLKNWEINGAIFDPPYSMEQISRSYKSVGINNWQSKYKNTNGAFPAVKKRIAELLKPEQVCISFGWNTGGLGKKNNMEIVEILIVAHGGNRNDTLVTVERKVK